MGLDNPLHIAFLLIVLLLVFGAKRLPEIGRSVGAGMREFKDSISGESHPTITQTAQQPPAPAQPVAAPVPANASAQPVAQPVAAAPESAPAEPTPQA
jgi:sec-independent protein translocase protein TatA